MNVLHYIAFKHPKYPAKIPQNTLHKAFAFCASYVGVSCF